MNCLFNAQRGSTGVECCVAALEKIGLYVDKHRAGQTTSPDGARERGTKMKSIATLMRATAVSLLWLMCLSQAHSEDLSGQPLTYMGKDLKRAELKSIREVSSSPALEMTRYLTVTRHPYRGCGSGPGQIVKAPGVDCPDVREVDTAGGTKKFFNNTCGVEPQEFVVSGYEVRFEDSGPWRQLWDRLNTANGKPVGNIARLVIYADKVVVAAPLKVPGGDVVIHARELVFDKNGSLDTTPDGNFNACDIRSAAWCKDDAAPTAQEINGVLTQACPDKTLVFRAKGDDGINGSRAGDIVLATETVDCGEDRKPCLIMSGGQGQQGGAGAVGLLGTSLPVLTWESFQPLCNRPNGCSNWWNLVNKKNDVISSVPTLIEQDQLVSVKRLIRGDWDAGK
jgi:hypothetical protein